MHPPNIRHLADALVRHYGPAKAIVIANQYVNACKLAGDQAAHTKWATVASLIAEEVQREGGRQGP